MMGDSGEDEHIRNGNDTVGKAAIAGARQVFQAKDAFGLNFIRISGAMI
jgi:hypothetical protein